MSGRKRVLFLDDDHRRIETIRSHPSSAAWDLTVVETADACIARLDEGVFDLVMLDHDLGGEIYCDSDREDCGMEVVRWLRRNRKDHGAFIVHTMNPVAAASMYIELSSMGYPVAQSTFGSPEFYRNIGLLLGEKAEIPKGSKKSLSERAQQYIRSLRRGK
ncbi:MAG: cyclic-phosphate processing receiver domain-containing protein [Bacteroidota bacterium]